MRILIYGAGVIGSLYAVLLSRAGYDVAIFARGARLEALRRDGLRYRTRRGGVETAPVRVLSRLEKKDRYDFIFLTVRENQLYAALESLRDNDSPTIVTMVNSLDTYDRWEALCGSGRILPAFPGAGDGFDGDVLDAALTPRAIQPTTFARSNGRERELANVFRRARVPFQIVNDMHTWQVCHLAMVVPIADAYGEARDPMRAGEDAALMRRTADRIQRNYRALARKGVRISPFKLNMFRFMPTALCGVLLGAVYRSDFGDRFMYRHAVKAPDEMRGLHRQFYQYMQTNGEGI